MSGPAHYTFLAITFQENKPVISEHTGRTFSDFLGSNSS